MALKNKIHITTGCSNGMQNLLLDDDITTGIKSEYQNLERILQQIQRDVLKDDPAKGEKWAIIKAIDEINDTLLLFAREGEHDLQARKTPSR